MSDAAAALDFERWSEQDVHFYSRQVPTLLASALRNAGDRPAVVDVGCGDGHLVWALKESGLLPAQARVVGVDVSPIRLRRFTALTGFPGLPAGDHTVPELAPASIDLALSTMVIEHIPDDLGHVRELARMVRPGGSIYLSTVVRKRGAWYFRKAPDGRRVLDPTHLREYPSVGAVLQLVESGGFAVRRTHVSRLWFPIAHPLVRLWHQRAPLADVQRLFLRQPWRWIEKLALPIPRYRSIEIVAERLPG